MGRGVFIGLFLLIAAGRPAAASDLAAQVAGSFYPADPVQLRNLIDVYLDQASTAAAPGQLLAVLAPHAGYVFSGRTAAQAYQALRGRSYRTVIVLGTGHYRPVQGAATMPDGTFATPLGKVEIDAQAVKRLEALSPDVRDEPDAFAGEHSVEVQLPFLQTVLKGPFKLVPLLMNTDDPAVCRRIGLALSGLIRAGRTLLVVSSDLSHYPDEETAEAVDSTSLLALRLSSEDPEFFWRTNRSLLARGGPALVCTECGEAAVLTALHAMKVLGARARLAAYSNSGLAGAERGRVVGYGAVLWSRGAAAPAPKLTQGERKELLKLARGALEAGLGKGSEPRAVLWKDPALGLPAAVFVTLRKKGLPEPESLRGCIGSLVPDLPLGEAVQSLAIKSATQDPRFEPVRAEELPDLELEISRLSPFRTVPDAASIRSGQGVVLSQGGRSGIFLPQVWQELPDKDSFLGELCSQKAGLPRDCWKDPKTRFQVFDAEVFQE